MDGITFMLGLKILFCLLIMHYPVRARYGGAICIYTRIIKATLTWIFIRNVSGRPKDPQFLCLCTFGGASGTGKWRTWYLKEPRLASKLLANLRQLQAQNQQWHPTVLKAGWALCSWGLLVFGATSLLSCSCPVTATGGVRLIPVNLSFC